MKYLLTISFFAALFLASGLAAMEDKTGGYATNNPAILKIIANKDDHAFAYGLLRRAEEVRDGEFRRVTTAFWFQVKHKNRLKRTDLADIAVSHWDMLAEQQQELALDLGLVKLDGTEEKYEPHLWDLCNANIGPTLTGALKFSAACFIISSLVLMPVAAAVMPHIAGTYVDSCSNVEIEHFQPRDPNLPDRLTLIRADCSYDRSCHGLKHNEIAIPSDGGACSFLHNDNGTLILTEASSLGKSSSGTNYACPELKGSFSQTCTVKRSSPYYSGDDRVPFHSYCKYQLSCAEKNGGAKEETLYLPKASVTCAGKLIENCDGSIKVRNGLGDDHQCDGKWRSHTGL